MAALTGMIPYLVAARPALAAPRRARWDRDRIGGTCRLVADPPRDGIVRTSPGPEGSKDKVALPGARRILKFSRLWTKRRGGANAHGCP